MSNWDGIERRNNKINGFCPAHIDLVSDLAVIKETVSNIEKSVSLSNSFKQGVSISIVSTMVVIIIQITSFSYLYGQIAKQVEINTGRLNVIEKTLFNK